MSLFPFRRKPAPDTPAPSAASAADLKAFERQYPGVQAELRALRAVIEANPLDTEPLLDRARYFLSSRLPSNRFNCADDCTRALELDPQCASAYALRAQTWDNGTLRGKAPARAALDYLSAWALDPTDTASRAGALRTSAAVVGGKDRAQELAALRELLAARVGEERAGRVVEAVKFHAG